MITGNVRTCPRRFSIFLCKWCPEDLNCGEQIKNMSDEERDAHYKEIFTPFRREKT